MDGIPASFDAKAGHSPVLRQRPHIMQNRMFRSVLAGALWEDVALGSLGVWGQACGCRQHFRRRACGGAGRAVQLGG
jgi:hypothetical protein